jgi:molybdopterin synthase sulfur carrier subunit
MPSFKIHLMESITYHAGKTELDVQAEEGVTLADLFKEVGREYGESMKNKFIAPDGDFQPYILISVNGTDARGMDGINTRLNEGDDVLLALLVTGG